MSAMYDFDKAETAPKWSELRPPISRRDLSFKENPPELKQARLEPISPPARLPGESGYAQAARILTGLDYISRVDLAPTGAPYYPYAEPSIPSHLGRIYGSLFQGVTAASVDLTAVASGSLTISTMSGSTANTSDIIQQFITHTRDALVGYERYVTGNWDGYGADPITSTTLAAARSFLQMLPPMFGEPDIAPGADGTIGLEWAFNNRPLRKLFIDIGPGPVWSGYWRRATGEKQALPMSPINATTKPFLDALFKKLNS
jgi:hypothetical protein